MVYCPLCVSAIQAEERAAREAVEKALARERAAVRCACCGGGPFCAPGAVCAGCAEQEDRTRRAEAVVEAVSARHQHPKRLGWNPLEECAICKALAAYDAGEAKDGKRAP